MLLGFTGFGGSGKDSAADMLIERIGGWTKMGFADALRQMALAINPRIRTGLKHYAEADGTTPYADLVRAVGYKRAKQFPDVREFLQRLGTEAIRDVIGPDIWVEILAERIEAALHSVNIVITDVRFPNEAQRIRDLGGYLVRVVRPGVGPVNAHASESEGLGIEVDWTLEANTLDELWNRVEALHIELLLAEEDKRYWAMLEQDAERV